MNKCRLIVLGAGETTFRFIESCLRNENMTLIGVIPDFSVDKQYLEGFSERLRAIGIDIFELTEENLEKADIIFSPEYRRIVPKAWTERFYIINCHGGILPKYRGFAANAWAIMNGEEEIGYTIHRMNAELDDGEIYFVKRIPIAPDQTYSDVHQRMIDSIVTEVPQLLVEISRGKCKGIKQNGPRVYGTRFSPDMGEIRNFDVPSQVLVDLYRCMAEPLGTGIYFFYKSERFNVNRIEHGKSKEVADYFAVPGKVVNMTDSELWVKTKDNVVVLKDLTDSDGAPVNLKKVFQNGCNIGKQF